MYNNNLVIIYFSDFDFYVLNLYRPPSNMEPDNYATLQFLYHFCSGKEILMLGDFNLPSVEWGLNYALSASSVIDSQFLDMFAALGLVQMVQVPTYFPSGNVLDLV